MSGNQIKTYYNDGSSNYYFIDVKPDKCPICHFTIDPIYRVAYYSGPCELEVEVIWRCPSNKCSRLFISYYEKGQYKNSLPRYPERPVVDEKIIKISGRFYNIYQQALAAKAYNLTELVGMGLRKALEFLIKDYCMTKNSQEAEKIKDMSLKNCIDKYSDGYVKECAHKSRILGNDETHYQRKYEDKDIKGLENLIEATLHWIGAELVVENYADIS